MQMITNIYLTEEATTKFNAWFRRVAKPGVDLQAVCLEALDGFQDALSEGYDPGYELSGQLTISGRPEIIDLSAADFEIEYGDDSDD